MVAVLKAGSRFCWNVAILGLVFSLGPLTACTLPSTKEDPQKMMDQANHAAASRIGVVNPQLVLERSVAGRGAIEQLKEYVASKQKLANAEEQEIKALDAQLKEQSKTLTEAQRQEKQRQLAVRVQQYQQQVQQLNQEIAARQRAVTNEYMQKIKTAIRTVAQEVGVSVVVHEGNEANLLVVLYHEPSVDLTERAIQEFDRQNH